MSTAGYEQLRLSPHAQPVVSKVSHGGGRTAGVAVFDSLGGLVSWQERFPGLTLLEQVTVDGVFQIAFFLCFLAVWFMGFVEFGQILTKPGLSDHER